MPTCKIAVCARASGSGDQPGNYQRGECLRPFEVSDEIGRSHSFLIFEISDASVAEMIDPVWTQWAVNIDWTVLNRDVAEDMFTVAAYSDLENASHTAGKLLEAGVQRILNKWNCNILNSDPDGDPAWVRFRFYLSNNSNKSESLVFSEGFWEHDVSNVVFSETGYDSGTGVHTIEADYSAEGWTPAKVEAHIVEKGGTVISDSGSVVEFSIPRNAVLNLFKEEANNYNDAEPIRRRYRLPEAEVAACEAAGDTVTKTKAQFLALLIDKVGE